MKADREHQNGQHRDIPGLAEQICSESGPEEHPSGKVYRVLTEKKAEQLSRRFGCSMRRLSMAAMDQGVILKRYLRNLESVSIAEQLELARHRVAVVGAGGLGGQVILSLTRLGIGELVLIDPDVFDESNLNRQALAELQHLGRPKVQVAREAVQRINPAVECNCRQDRLGPDNALKLLNGARVVVDCLDSVADRFLLEDAAKELGLPLVHAAIDGFLAQLMTIFPQDQGLELLYGQRQDTPKSPLGNPVFAPSLVAVLQAMEVLKIILKRGQPLRKAMLSLELESGSLERFSFHIENQT